MGSQVVFGLKGATAVSAVVGLNALAANSSLWDLVGFLLIHFPDTSGPVDK